MNETCIPQEGLRRAALSLHGLPEQDRRWVLAALRPDQRAVLETMLAELQELGMPADANLHAALLDASTVRAAIPSDIPSLEALDVGALVDVLQKEPPKLTAVLLRAGAWPCGEDALAAFDAHFAREVRRSASSAAQAPALQSAVLSAVRRRLATEPQRRPAMHVRLWRRVASGLRRRWA